MSLASVLAEPDEDVKLNSGFIKQYCGGDKFHTRTLNLDYDLIEASRRGDHEEVKKLLKEGANVCYRNQEALNYACARRHKNIIETLIAAGADPSKNNCEALHTALCRSIFPGGYVITNALPKIPSIPPETFSRTLKTDQIDLDLAKLLIGC